MANGHVEIHDPLSNHNDLSTDCDPGSDSDGMGGTMEFRLLMVYATRRHSKGPSSPQTPASTEKEVKEEEEEEKKKKKKKKMRSGRKRLLRILSCIKPRIKDDAEEPSRCVVNKPDVSDRCGHFEDVLPGEVREKNELEDVVSRLTEIADEIPFIPPEVEADSDEDEVERVIGLLLREAGDRLNEQELKNANIAAELFWNYGFFERLIRTLLIRMGLMTAEPDALGPQASPKTQIAVTCEVTSRLSAVDTLPMSRMLNHGARYLRDHYSTWAQQQGGYEEAFHSDDEDDEVQ